MLAVQYSHPLRINPSLFKLNYLLYIIYSISIFAYLHGEQNTALCNIFYFVLTLFQYVYKPLLIGTIMIYNIGAVINCLYNVLYMVLYNVHAMVQIKSTQENQCLIKLNK
jgi:hypothetical protein